jgi:fructose-1,6-bisphosphatase II
MGTGGAPEAVVAACALKAMGGDMQCKLYFRDVNEYRSAVKNGIDPDQVLTIDDLVTSDDTFFAATGITDGELLHGVRYGSGQATTESLVMRAKSGTIRYIRAFHHGDKLANILS